MKSLFLSLAVIMFSSNVYAQGYIGKTIYDDQVVDGEIQKGAKKNPNIQGDARQISYTPMFKYGQAYIKGKKLTFNEFGFLILKSNYVSGLSYEKTSSGSFKITNVSLNAGWQFNTDTSFFNKPYILASGGFSTTENNGIEYKGLVVGLDVGVEVYRINNFAIAAGVKVSNYSNESTTNPSSTDRKMYVGFGVSF